MSSLSKQSNWVALTITIYNYTIILALIALYDYIFLSLTFGQNVDRSGFAITIWDWCLCVRVGVETFTSSQFYFACWPKQFFHLDSWIERMRVNINWTEFSSPEMSRIILDTQPRTRMHQTPKFQCLSPRESLEGSIKLPTSHSQTLIDYNSTNHFSIKH